MEIDDLGSLRFFRFLHGRERERWVKILAHLCTLALLLLLPFRAIEKNTPRQLQIPDELQIELNRHRINTSTYLLRLFTQRFSKGSMIRPSFFFLCSFISLSLSLSLSLVGARMNIKELRGRGKSGFQGIDFHRVGPNIVANSLVTVFSYYHDELIRR